MRKSWDEYFMSMTDIVASRSKDPSTKVGCIIVGPDHEVRSTGYNDFPRGVREDLPCRRERPAKYRYTEHAERNAIYNAARCGVSVKGCTMYINAGYPCTDCSRGIIQVGIKEIVVGKMEYIPGWEDDCKLARSMLHEAGIPIRLPLMASDGYA